MPVRPAAPSAAAGCCTECGPNSANPATVEPTVVAPWMEDLDDTASNGIQYLDGIDTAGNNFLTIDYNGVVTSLFSGTNLNNFLCQFDPPSTAAALSTGTATRTATSSRSRSTSSPAPA